MVNFSWSLEMSVGVPALDADHRVLIDIINMLQVIDEQKAGDVVDQALTSLADYGRNHFAREEEVMRSCGFPGLEFHKSEHAGFTRFVKHLRQRYARAAGIDVIDELRDHLTHWLCHHILIQDMAYKPYVLAARGLALPDTPPPPGDRNGSRLAVLPS